MPGSIPSASSHRTGWPWTIESARRPDRICGRPRVTIITPSFNQGDFIEETIRSVLLQEYPNLQYIVIDGGSTDGSVDVIRKYAPWIDRWESAPDRGQSHAINKGLARADGEWFNWLNSDDVLQPGALHRLATAAAKSPTLKIVAGLTENIRDGRVFGLYGARFNPADPAPHFSLGVNQPGSLLHRASVLALGGVREDLPLTMDLDLWLRLLLAHGSAAFASIPETVARYRYHVGSKTCSAEDVFALEEFALLFDLASQFGVKNQPGLTALRRCSASQPTRFPTTTAPAMAVAERAWLDRMIVSDSLLFRALRRNSPESNYLGRRFICVLDELNPQLRQYYPSDWRRIEARALIQAQQALGHYEGSMSGRALARHPGANTMLEILRLCARRWRKAVRP